jgi:hypothetical protein
LELTTNFRAGLKAAYDSLDLEGSLTERDHQVVGQLLENPVLTSPGGERIFAMKRVHLRVRRYYARQMGAPFPFDIDWTKIVDWIKEHWVDIIRIILAILPFLIL